MNTLVIKITGALLLAGTIIGAGILGLPYALAQNGFWGGSVLLLLGGFFSYLCAAYIAVLVYQEKSQMPLQALVSKYLGKKMGILTLLAVMFASYGALSAYPIAIGEIVHSLTGLPHGVGALTLLFFMSGLLSLNIGRSSKINAAIAILLSFLLLGVIFKAFSAVNPENLLWFRPGSFIQSWGVVVFAFAGHLVIPSVIYFIDLEQKDGLQVIKWGLGGVGLLYFIFFLASVGVMGREITPVATLGLGQILGSGVALAGQLFAILAIITSFFGIGLALRLTFENQFQLKRNFSLFFILMPVLVINLYLASSGGEAFIKILNYAGGVGSALYAGIIPALLVLEVKNAYKFPLGMAGALAALLFYGWVVMLTIL